MYLPEDVKYIIDTLYEHGHEAYAVGGCVRDMMLGREPGDWDITTSAMPEETKELFERTFDTGIEHGTITVLLNGVGYEVTTYRIDGTYEDSRHPSEVSFTRNLEEDLLRRDFTINAMAYNDREGIVDIYEGMKDLEEKCIRCVGDPEARFGEDALRILRGVRFSAQLGFEIEEETKAGIQTLARTLENISAERIQVEMVKLLVSPHPEYIDMAYQLGVTKIIFPEWDEIMQDNYLGRVALEALRNVEPDKMLRITALLYGTNEQVAKRVLRRWKFDNETVRVVSQLVRFREYVVETNPYSVRKAMHEMGADLFAKHIVVLGGDLLAKEQVSRMEHFPIQDQLDAQKQLALVEKLYLEILEKQECTTLKDLAVKGNDLLACGVEQGKEIGEVLKKLLDLVIEVPEYNTKGYLLEKVREMKKENL